MTSADAERIALPKTRASSRARLPCPGYQDSITRRTMTGEAGGPSRNAPSIVRQASCAKLVGGKVQPCYTWSRHSVVVWWAPEIARVNGAQWHWSTADRGPLSTTVWRDAV